MNIKRALQVLFKAWPVIVKVCRYYLDSREKQSKQDEFIERCEKARAYAEDVLKITVKCSERVGDFYYLIGTYPNGSPYKLKMQKGK